MDSEENLESRLREIMQRPANPPSSGSPENLRNVSEQRLNDYEEVIDVLKKSRGRGLGAEYHWTEEYLEIAGNTSTDLACLLVDEKYDAPWILRPAYKKLYLAEPWLEFSASFSTHHSPGCGHRVDASNQNLLPVEEHGLDQDHLPKSTSKHVFRESKGTNPRVNATADLLLGIAGYVPQRQPQKWGFWRGYNDHEPWMHEIRSHVRFDARDNAVLSVAYGSADQDPSQAITKVVKQACVALTLFKNAVASLQESGSICDSVPILFKTQIDSVAVVEVINLELSLAESLYKSLEEVKSWGESEGQDFEPLSAAWRVAETARTARTGKDRILASLGYSFLRDDRSSIVTTTSGMTGTVTNTSSSGGSSYLSSSSGTSGSYMSNIMSALDAAAQDISAIKAAGVGGNSRQPRVLPECFEDLHRACNNFFHSFSPTISIPTDLLIEEFLLDGMALSLVHILDRAACCIQIFCLGLQSFVRSHTGMPQFSLMDREVKMIFLNGAELLEPRRIDGRFVAHLQELTCLSDMTHGPVLVFEELRSTPSANDLPNLTGKAPCDLLCSLEDVIYIWGEAKVEFADLISERGQRHHINTLQLGGGILYPNQPGGQNWHWMSENDPAIPNALEALQKVHPKISVDIREKIRIGSLLINRDCPLSTENGRKVLSSILVDHVRSLQTFAPHWQLNSIHGGIQGGQYVTPQFMLGWNKKPGQTEKQNLLNPTNNTLLPELSNLYGLQISLCTGLMYRIPLQRLIASRLESYIRSRGPSVAEWFKLEEEWQISKAFYESDIAEWFRKLPKESHPAAWMLVKEILCQLQHTGIDHENMLRIGWIQANDALKCLKIKCSGGNSWAKILTDSPDVVTFACVEPTCMQSSSPRHKCSGKLPESYDPLRPLQLHTRVRPLRIDDQGSTSRLKWTLEDGRSYWMGPKDLMMLATANLKEGVAQLSVKQSKIPVRYFRRSSPQVTLRETNDESALECFVGAYESFQEKEVVKEASVASVPLTAPRTQIQSSPLRSAAAATGIA
ncbi:hypothetical protein NA56DRAFT_480712 [Hyaloscypha hepaticicola]|uniref:Uncharacterized protein n=1 Tax=Hyaloscypha hepaticicola TaxID=2082293 RepID=A0A2J6PF31_9HELO|nr:hypothetical protein NA56DRAFT_480712 [Hyaloscypha hepaticicola]